jgi:hypothetical protein
MIYRNKYKPAHLLTGILLLAGMVLLCADAQATLWQRKSVNWRGPGNRQIKGIYYPVDQNLPLLENRIGRKPVHTELKSKLEQDISSLNVATTTSVPDIFTNVINSPPIDGFTPYITVAITDQWSQELYNVDAVTEYSIIGSYLSGRMADYVIGIFDTGSSAHIINAYDAISTGIYDADLVTTKTVQLIGAAGTIDALISQPLAIFGDGLGAIDANTLEVNDSNMVGQSNVAIIVGDTIESPNLPTVIGSPMAFFFTTVIKNSSPITLNIGGENVTAPDIHIYEHSDSGVPMYANKITLEMLPSDGEAVQFFPCLEILGDDCPEGDGEPTTPSVVFGSFLDVPQSLFFATRTDLTQGVRSSQQNHFMFDTGAQITVISESTAAELELFQNDPNFYVEIIDATGASTIVDGYYIDLLEITATPSWLSFTHVPVVILDVTSPEGGVLDGIIGMNLFADLDFYIHGGGLPGQDSPYIKFAFLPPGLTGDIAPTPGDGVVDELDLAAMADAWLTNPLSSNWNSRADIIGDAIIDFYDFAAMAQNWQ